MYARLFIVFELLIALIGSLCATLLFVYFDPERGLATASILMGAALFLSLSSLG
jgi:predicted membrane-bound spermidine synthase